MTTIREPTKLVPPAEFPDWPTFELALAEVLSRMAVDTYLVLDAPADGPGSSYYVQFAQGGRSGLLVEAVSNRYLVGRSALSPQQEAQMADLGWQFPSPRSTTDLNFSRQWPMPAPFEEVAGLAVRTLREVYGVHATSGLTYSSFARGGKGFAQPTLGINAEAVDAAAPSAAPSAVPSPPPTKPAKPAAPTMASIRPVVEQALKTLLKRTEITYDRDGDIPIRFGSALVFLRLIDGAPPVVRLFSPVVWNIPGSPELLEAINLINTQIRFGRVAWTGREVMASVEVPVFHLSAEDIGFACLQLGGMADAFDDGLQQRFGGHTMFGPSTGLVH